MPAPNPSHANSGSRGFGQGYGGHVPPTPSYMTRPQQQPPAQSDSHHFQYSPPPPPPPRPASAASPPNLDQLVEMSTDAIGSLSISALKSILFTNHVATGQILEKSDLVKKVLVLVENEKSERVRQRQIQERDEMERLQRAMETMPGTTNLFEQDSEEQTMEQPQQQEDGDTEDQQAEESRPDFDTPIHLSDDDGDDDDESRNNDEGGQDETNHPRSSSTPAATPSHQPKATGFSFERPGMCVICQDEDANIAIIDCGYVNVILFYIIFHLIYAYFFFTHIFQKVIWRCVEDAPNWLWRARKSVLCVVHVLSLRLDCFAFLGHRTCGSREGFVIVKY